jgi:hypothetical protein
MACNINVRLMGGLGNQMFQYAAALALAKKLGSGICLNISSFNHSNLRKFDLDKFILTGSQTELMKVISHSLPGSAGVLGLLNQASIARDSFIMMRPCLIYLTRQH